MRRRPGRGAGHVSPSPDNSQCQWERPLVMRPPPEHSWTRHAAVWECLWLLWRLARPPPISGSDLRVPLGNPQKSLPLWIFTLTTLARKPIGHVRFQGLDPMTLGTFIAHCLPPVFCA